jgi:hypothetical protein
LDEKKSFDERDLRLCGVPEPRWSNSHHMREEFILFMVSFREALGSEEIDGLARGGTKTRSEVSEFKYFMRFVEVVRLFFYSFMLLIL